MSYFRFLLIFFLTSDKEECCYSVKLLEFVELALSLDRDVIFTNCMLLLVHNEQILVVVGGEDCGDSGCCLFAYCCVDFLGIECAMSFYYFVIHY